MTYSSFMLPTLLATDYGNMWAFLLVVPAIGISLLLGGILWLARKTTAHRACGLIAILLSAIFLFTIGEAREFDRVATFAFSVVGGCLGFLLMRAGAKNV